MEVSQQSGSAATPNSSGSQKNASQLQAEAQQAIRDGASVHAVNTRLKEYGLPPVGSNSSEEATPSAPGQAQASAQPSAQSLPERISKASSNPHAFATLAYEAKEQLPVLKQRIQNIQRVFNTLPSEAQQIMQKTLDQTQGEAQMYESILAQQSARTGLPN